ncbi:hypothetical protein GGR58DRAFT_507589 [Xylaria digitata]|nr:hypothetical protein GGR58DRAFT_507589 [Xylaria digitata]
MLRYYGNTIGSSASASTDGSSVDESSASSASGVPTAITMVTTAPAGSTPADSQTDSRTSVSTEGSAADQSFANISSASRVTTPSFARSLLTVTRTITTLITTTLTATR